ncbi:MAG: hypothetical protein JKY66_03360 [Spongiibacteraceae bacterium]|nr:hypothetical protein [Spongiibacteraceae bacterium]
MIEDLQRTQIRNAVKKQLKKTKPSTKSGKKVGRFDADTQAILDFARNIMGMKQETAAAKLEEVLIKADPSPAGIFEHRLLALASNNPDMNITDAENLLIDIIALRTEGAAQGLARIVGRRRARNKAVSLGRDAVTQGEQVRAMDTTSLFSRLKARGKDVLTSYSAMHDAWDDVLDTVFNKKGTDASPLIESLRLTEQIQDTKGLVEQWENRLRTITEEVYGVEGDSKVMNKHIEDGIRKDFGLFENAREVPETVRLEYSLAEIRKLWMEDQDPTISDVINHKDGMAFTDEMERALFDTMTAEDQEFARRQLGLYREMYKTINPVYRRLYGVNLPFNEFYSPIQRDKGDNAQDNSADSFGSDRIVSDEQQFRRSLPRNIKSRSENIVPLMKRGDVGAMQRYIHDMAWFVKTTERVLFIKSVFDSQPLRKDIRLKHGKGMMPVIDSFLRDFGTGYPNNGVVAEQMINGFNRLFSSSVLSLKGTIGTKQLVSLFAMADNVPSGLFAKSVGQFLLNPAMAVKIVRTLFNGSAALRARGSSLDFELARINQLPDQVFQSGGKGLARKWQNFKFAFIHYGDRFPIYAGGWAVYQNALRQGKSKAQAIRAFEDAFNSTQQSTDIDKMSVLQRASPMGRTLTMFMTARMALLRGEIRAIRQFKRKKITAREFGKRMAYYHLVMPMFIQFIASGFRWEPDRQLIAATLGQVNSIVILGDALTHAAMEIFGDEESQFFVGGSSIPIVDFFSDAIRGVKDVFTFEDGEELIEALLDLAGVAGQLLGQPVDQVTNIIGGFNDIMEGDVEQGLKRQWGFSKKVAEDSSE